MLHYGDRRRDTRFRDLEVLESLCDASIDLIHDSCVGSSFLATVSSRGHHSKHPLTMFLFQLRDIEILVQQQLEVLEGAGNDDETLREIQKILYST